jgi:hypothetical protein
VTDHRPLEFFIGPHPQGTVSWVQARMLDVLATFSMSIVWAPGSSKQMLFADYLSRVRKTTGTPCMSLDPTTLTNITDVTVDEAALQEEDDEFPDRSPAAMAGICPATIDPARARALYEHDPHTRGILAVSRGGPPHHHHHRKCSLTDDGLIALSPHPLAMFRRSAILIPSPPPDAPKAATAAASTLKNDILSPHHDIPSAGHHGPEVTHSSARLDFF